jgi:hypothetical protein
VEVDEGVAVNVAQENPVALVTRVDDTDRSGAVVRVRYCAFHCVFHPARHFARRRYGYVCRARKGRTS